MRRNPQIDLAEQYVRNTHVSLFLTGKAGTGKTTFLHHITQSIHKRYAIVAPTGVAAVNAGGVTIHSFFQLPFCPYLPDVPELVTEYQMPEQRKQMRRNKIDVIRTLELLIIDEISMVRADLLDAIDYTLRRYRRSNKPFGGLQLLMIGDIRQLPPVVTDDEKPYMDRVYPSPFFFHSKALQRIHYITIELTTIYRQQDAAFVALLNNIRDNRFDADTLARLNQRCQPSFDGDGKHNYIRLTTHNHQADSVNRSRMAQLQSRSFVAEAIVEGTFPDSSAPTDRHLELKEGEQVMFVKNDSSGEHRYYNGKIGVISSLSSDSEGINIAVRDEHGEHITVGRETWENIKYEIDPADNQIKQRTEGTFTQYPLRPAWAITIHKAQGLTFDHVIIDAAAAFAYGQVYVALSRCRSYEGLVLSSPISSAGAIASQDIIDFDQSRPSETEVRNALHGYETQYYYDTLFEMFDMSGLLHHLERLRRTYMERLRNIYPAHCDNLVQICNEVSQLSEVSDKFRHQLMQLSIDHASDSDIIRERINKGAHYYAEQIEQLSKRLQPLTGLEIDNQETRKEAEESTQKMQEVLRLKKLCFSRVVKQGFSIETYSKAKVDATLEVQNKEKNTLREKKTTTSIETYATEPNPRLISILSHWRKNKSEEMNLPAFMIFHQKTLLALARKTPHTVKELQGIPGLGKVKIKQFGEELLQIIRDYAD